MDKEEINLLRPRRLHGWQDPLQSEPKIKRSFLFYFIPGLIIIFLFSSFAVAKKYTLNRWSDNPTDYDQITLQPKKIGLFGAVKNLIFRPDNVMVGQQQDRINILLLGMSGEGHDGAYLTDTNITLSIKPSTNEVAMTSIPRDLSAKIKGYDWVKINHANAYGENEKAGYGGEFARQTFEQNLGIKIPYYIRIDFQAFTEIINTIGGLEIDVQRSFVDYSYPGPDYSYQTVYFKEGKEKMDGERALIYARSRQGTNGEGSDFARAKRQQIVIAALKNKLLSAGTYLNPIKIKKIIDSLTTHISTNLDFGQIMYLANLTRNVDDNKIKTLVLDDAPDGYLRPLIGYDGAYLLTPRTGSFGQIQQAIEHIFDNTTSTPVYSLTATAQTELTFPSAKIEIQNGTWRVGLASRIKKDLEDKGFAIYAVGNSSDRPIASTSIYILNQTVESGFIDALERELRIKSTATLPNWLQTSPTSTSSTLALTTTSLSTTTTTTTTTTVATTTNKFDPESDILIILGEDTTTT